MSVAGYFTSPAPAREKSLEEWWAEDAVRARSGDGEFYSGLEDYDPVLKGHCPTRTEGSLAADERG